MKKKKIKVQELSGYLRSSIHHT